MFAKDDRTSDQKQRDADQTEAIGRLIIGALFLVILPYLTLSALLGYLFYCAWKEKKVLGVATVGFIAVAIIFYLVGPPGAVGKPFLIHWEGALFSDFKTSFDSFYHWIYSTLHFRMNQKTYFKFIELTRLMFYGTIPGAIAFVAYLSYQKRWEEVKLGLYQLFKAPIQLWLKLPTDPTYTVGTKIFFLIIQLTIVLLPARFLIPWIFGVYWPFHLARFVVAVGGIIGAIAIYLSEQSQPKEDRDVIRIGNDGTALSPKILNHHVHVLGESGFGKTVFLTRIIEHHVKHGMGLIFIDLKADTDTVSQIVGLCERHNRLEDLKLFDCSRPELSSPYNVLLRGNPTEIKDTLVGSFAWESEYYKNAAQSFLLSVIRALVWMRDNQSVSFTLGDLYEATLSADALVALQIEMAKCHAPENLREDINGLAHYLRARDNFKELHGLRTQIKLLIDSEFGPLLTDPGSGIDIFDCIQSHKIVYVLLDSQRYGESAKKLGKLILQDLKSASSKIIEEIPRNERVPCAIIVDEFADLATEQFVGFLNRARGSKLGIVIAHQEMSDLEAFSPTMRDQVMGNTSTTVSFLQKMPDSAEILAQIAGTKTTVKSTRQVKEDTFFITTRQYTGVESEREVEEFIIHPNTFKNLKVGECVIIGKYPSPWNKKVTIPPPEEIRIDKAALREKLKALRRSSEDSGALRPLGLKALVKSLYAKTATKAEPQDKMTPPPPAQPRETSPSTDPNF